LQTTYCAGMQQYLQLLKRNASVINLDPANEIFREEKDTSQELPYDCVFDVCSDAIDLSSVMQEMQLGPNGGLVYCMEYLEKHADDIIRMIRAKVTPGMYVLIDLPGQVELYTHSNCIKRLLHRLSKALDLRLTMVQLVDAHYCTSPNMFISAAILGTTSMIRLELPTVSVLSKIDLLSQYGELPFDFEYFTECHSLDMLIPFLESSLESEEGNDADGYQEDPEFIAARRKRQQSRMTQKYKRLQTVLADVVEDFNLLGFLPLNISDAASVGRVLAKVDKCNGYVFTESSINEDLFNCAVSSDVSNFEAVAEVRERQSLPRST